MAVDIIQTPISSLQNETTAIAALNANSAAVVTAFQGVLGLAGTSPNQMQSNLDMNSNQVINLPFPGSLDSPVRLTDVINSGVTADVIPFTSTSTASVPGNFSATHYITVVISGTTYYIPVSTATW